MYMALQEAYKESSASVEQLHQIVDHFQDDCQTVEQRAESLFHTHQELNHWEEIKCNHTGHL